MNGKTYEEFYDTEITGKNGPVEAEINVTNITNFIIPDIKIVVWYIDVLTNDIEVEVSPMSKTFTLFRNETYTYVAMLDADMTDKFRKAGKYRAIILCESPDNLNSGALAETPSVFWDAGDDDPYYGEPDVHRSSRNRKRSQRAHPVRTRASVGRCRHERSTVS